MKCPDCEDGELVPRRGRYGDFYGCTNWPECRGTYSGKEGVTVADRKTRHWRQKVHDALDPIWKDGLLTRDEAYKLLANQMHLSQEDCHIGKFGVTQCGLALQIIQSWREHPAFLHKLLDRSGRP